MLKRFLILTLLVFILGCGTPSGPPILTITPQSASIETNYALGTYTGVTLTATLSGTTTPPQVTWSTTDACIPAVSSGPNTANSVCNFTCGGSTRTATITATTLDGIKGHAAITCAWIS